MVPIVRMLSVWSVAPSVAVEHDADGRSTPGSRRSRPCTVYGYSGHVWTAPGCQGTSDALGGWSWQPCVRPFDAALTWPLALMPSADRVPVKSSHSQCHGPSGLSRSPVRPGLHNVLSALSNHSVTRPRVLTGTNRICGRWTASQIASASVASFLWRLT